VGHVVGANDHIRVSIEGADIGNRARKIGGSVLGIGCAVGDVGIGYLRNGHVPEAVCVERALP
jgi:hypothetical protein